MRDDYVGAPMMVAAFGGVALFAVAMGMAVTSIAHHHPAPPPKHTAHTARPPNPSITQAAAAPSATTAVAELSGDARAIAQTVSTPTPSIGVLETTCSEVKNLVLPPLSAGTDAAASARWGDIVLDDVALQRTCGVTILDVAASHGASPVATTDEQRLTHAAAVLRADVSLLSADIGRS